VRMVGGRVPDRRWLFLFVLFLARTALALLIQAVASAGPFLIAALAIDYASLGLLIGLHSLPGVAIAIPVGSSAKVWRQTRGAHRSLPHGDGWHRYRVIQSFPVAAVGRMVLGVGAVLFNVLATKMLSDWFSGREIATAMGTRVASWTL
jgi:hypothetical protein